MPTAGHAVRLDREPALPAPLGDVLALVRERAPILDRAIREHGDLPLDEYLGRAFEVTRDPCQDPGDLFDAMAAQATRRLGPGVGERLRADLRALPVVLTANHHGVDFFAQSVQGSLLFGRRGGEPRATVPVLACATVPLDNLTYPLGLLLYDAETAERLPARVPVFPNRLRRHLVAVAPPITEEMAARAGERLARRAAEGALGEAVAAAGRAVLDEVYAPAAREAGAGYSEQATRINAELWRRLHAGARAPELVCLELEAVAAEVLALDLARPDSLAALVFGRRRAREVLFAALDEAPACWRSDRLAARLAGDAANGVGAGTFLLWGVDGQGRKVPLAPSPDGEPALVGVDDRGGRWRQGLDPDSLVPALAERRVLPSLLTTFLVIALARGVTCAGAYYQAHYLPRMQRGLGEALGAAGAPDLLGARVARVPTGAYLAGMQTVLHRLRDGGAVPAGVLETIAGGGLDAGALASIGRTTVRDAHLASLAETFPDLAPELARSAPWRESLARATARHLGERLVTR